jgi:hypothetical protein
MIKQFRVTGMLATRLEELGISIPAVLRRAAFPQDFFKHTRILVSTPETLRSLASDCGCK